MTSQDLLQPVALSLQLGGGMLLVWTGAMKLADPAPIRLTITALGFRGSNVIAPLLATCEIGAGFALILMPAPWLAALAVVTLAILFASAASVSLIRRLQVDCACFGSRQSKPLGWRQFVMMPVWAAIAVSVVAVPSMLRPERSAFALGGLLFIALPSVRNLGILYLEHRAQRIAIEGS